MVKNIVKDVMFLKTPSKDMTKEDLYIINDLVDTLKANQKRCVGMAANMIGYSKNAIVILLDNGTILPMINPNIIDKKDLYETEEGCLSLDGVRPCKRYKKIAVSYLDVDFKIKTKRFKDFEAQIIQHEIDHLFGIII